MGTRGGGVVCIRHLRTSPEIFYLACDVSSMILAATTMYSITIGMIIALAHRAVLA